jgi:hypothetical protein
MISLSTRQGRQLTKSGDMAVTVSGEMVIAYEGGGGRPATLTIYPADYRRQVLSRFDSTSAAVSNLSSEAAR